MNALDRVSAKDVVTFAGAFLGRFGIGATRGIGSVYPAAPSKDPSKYDDHRDDSTDEMAEAA